MSEPLIVLEDLSRVYASGESTVVALDRVNIRIDAGEMVAIVGQSGSGKTTLMNILGCLDHPTSGHYRIGGRDVGGLGMDDLAALRREHFGFIFQRYHLLGELTALGNVEMPAVYAGLSLASRADKATRLLERLGMEKRLRHTPGQLSGGQQQRVSIARALINGADVILADEPTGALDSRSGEEVLRILHEIHAEGRTVIIVTHDMSVARRARRIIEMRDGVVTSDKPNPEEPPVPIDHVVKEDKPARAAGNWHNAVDRFREALRMALLSMNAHRMRAFLTMLGIIIGIASVICVVAVGAGSQERVLANINSLGTNTLEVFPGKDFGDVRSAKIKTLILGDVRALESQPYVAAATPTVTTTSTARFGAIEVSTQVSGIGDQYFAVKGTELAEGSFLDADSVRRYTQETVIDDNARKALFPDGSSPVGQIILVGRVPCRIIGVTRQQQGGFGSSANPTLYLPYTTVQGRFLGDRSLRSISIRVDDATPTDLAESMLTRLLTDRHGSKDFFVLNTNDIRRTIENTTNILTMLIAAIAVISLIVGGIGVMNIMLVSVSERISEIGVRMAVGARQADILQQFLIEAVLVCLIGGTLGIALSLGIGVVFNAFDVGVRLIYSSTSIVVAVLSSTTIGVAFGYVPARNASRLDPVAALSRE